MTPPHQDPDHPSLREGTDRLLTLSDFDYEFPERLIAQEPQAERDRARLLVRAADGALRHAHVADLTTELPAGTLLILNDSQVFPSRLFGTLPSGGKVELFLLEPAEGGAGDESLWRALGRPMRKMSEGTRIQLAGGLTAEVRGRTDEGETAVLTLAFQTTPGALAPWLETHGYIPLPPYIKRPNALPAGASPDRERYQTVYAQERSERGSVAAPTAGLHFTKPLLAALAQRGVEIRYVSLHVGGGTFLPVKTEYPREHKMHRERALVPRETAAAIAKAKSEGRRVVAVGTTSFRTLEDLYRRAEGDPERFVALAGAWHTTDLFVYPEREHDRYRPWVIDGIITNFHQPKSTLFMLVAALVGLSEAKRFYVEAIGAEYRLYSYGDAGLFWLSD
jgi:S-adenosylmethionine:tRNA ribosyltransferase-isomerase